MTRDIETIQKWIDDVNNDGVNLSKWELDFMESITEQFASWKRISERQEEILERIYSEKTS